MPTTTKKDETSSDTKSQHIGNPDATQRSGRAWERRSKEAYDGPAADGAGMSGLCSDDMDELVEYMAPLIMGKSDQTIFCQVNGENIRLQRGKMVKIKRKFKEVLDQSAQQEMAAYAFMEQAQRGSANALADLK